MTRTRAGSNGRKVNAPFKIDPEHLAWMKDRVAKGRAVYPGMLADSVNLGTVFAALVEWARAEEKAKRLTIEKLFGLDSR